MSKTPRVPPRRNPVAKALRAPSLRAKVAADARTWSKADRRRAKLELRTRPLPEPRAEPSTARLGTPGGAR